MSSASQFLGGASPLTKPYIILKPTVIPTSVLNGLGGLKITKLLNGTTDPLTTFINILGAGYFDSVAVANVATEPADFEIIKDGQVWAKSDGDDWAEVGAVSSRQDIIGNGIPVSADLTRQLQYFNESLEIKARGESGIATPRNITVQGLFAVEA